MTSPAPPNRATQSLLPSGLIWVYAVAPVATACLMSPQVGAWPLPEFLRRVWSNYVPFFFFGSAFHLVYRYAVPPVLTRLRSTAARIATHVLTVLVVSVVVAIAVRPLVEIACGHPLPGAGFIVVSTVISSCCVFPGLIVQRLRLRAWEAERRADAERQAALRAQLAALQARTNPHFLFNSLNTVAALIPEDPDRAERTLERLADLFRYALESSRTRSVPFKREVEMISDYLALQTARFGDRLRTTIDVPVALADIEVPPLLLQPLVENAILHGTSRHRGGEVRVSARREGDWLVIDVVDDGPGPGDSRHRGAGSAVAGITERIRLHYAGRGQLALERRAEGGCLARMTLPVASAA